MAADESSGLEWLRAVIEGDMALAKDALTPGSGISPEWNEPSSGVLITGDGSDLDGLWSLGDSRLSRHIAAHDPADTIARCEAELALISDYEQFRDDPEFGPTQRHWTMLGIGTAVRHIASGYKHRPGYTENWRP